MRLEQQRLGAGRIVDLDQRLEREPQLVGSGLALDRPGACRGAAPLPRPMVGRGADDRAAARSRRERSPCAQAARPAAGRAPRRARPGAAPSSTRGESLAVYSSALATGVRASSGSAAMPAAALSQSPARIAANTPRQSRRHDHDRRRSAGRGDDRRRQRAARCDVGLVGRARAGWLHVVGGTVERRQRIGLRQRRVAARPARQQAINRSPSSFFLHQQQQILPCQRLVRRPLEQLARVEGGDGAHAFDLVDMAARRRAAACRAAPGRRVAEQQQPLRLGQADVVAGDGRRRRRSPPSLSRAPGAWKQDSEALIGARRRRCRSPRASCRSAPRPRRRSAGPRRHPRAPGGRLSSMTGAHSPARAAGSAAPSPTVERQLGAARQPVLEARRASRALRLGDVGERRGFGAAPALVAAASASRAALPARRRRPRPRATSQAGCAASAASIVSAFPHPSAFCRPRLTARSRNWQGMATWRSDGRSRATRGTSG